jgi:hypothetical protein
VIIVDVTQGGRPEWLVTHAMPTSANKGKTRKKMLKGKGRRAR